MLALALGIAIFSYILFALGILGLYNNVFYVLFVILFVVFIGVISYVYNVKAVFTEFYRFLRYEKSKVSRIALFLLFIALAVSFIIALAPERAFDALWYHLTIPKLYVLNHGIYFIPGSLLYYSAMPKLLDLLYVIPIAWNVDVFTRLFSFIFGVLTLIVTWQFARKFLRKDLALLVLVLLISNHVFLWQLTTAYVDMARTFFEVLSLFAFFRWMGERKKLLFIESALCMGTAIAIKPNACLSLFSLSLVLFCYCLYKYGLLHSLKKTGTFLLFSILVPLPWFLFAFIHTGNPFYPLFSRLLPGGFSAELLNPVRFISIAFDIFTKSPDPVSPLYLIILPLVVVVFRTIKSQERLLLFYAAVSFILWGIFPIQGGARYILPYLPILSILSILVLDRFSSNHAKKYIYALIFIVAVSSIFARFLSMVKVVPVVFGFQTEQSYLKDHLNFSYGDIYDTDGELGKILSEDDTVLVYGAHNLYYLNFPYIHESWVMRGDVFNYILTQNTEIPEGFWDFKPVYENSKTGVRLYSEGGFWKY